MVEEKKEATSWNSRLDFQTFCAVLGQFRTGQIGEGEAWFLLGFDGDGGQTRPEARRRLTRPSRQTLGLAPSAYLVPKEGTKKAAHIWDGRDTACRMASTGGLSASGYTVTDSPGPRRVCALCKEKWGRWS